MKRKQSINFIVVVVILALGVLLIVKSQYTPANIVKTAVKEKELSTSSYILCKMARVTGFDWIMIKNENGEEVDEFCNINGSTPKELRLNYEFTISHNIFVIYVEEKTMVYSEATKQEEMEYLASGWDILYPVKHGFPYKWTDSKKYITEDDLWR